MNAIDLLKTDHRIVDALFQTAESATPAERKPIFEKIRNELEVHAHVEEVIFYPTLRRRGNKDLVDIVLEGIEEHSQIKKFLFEMDALQTKNEKFEPKLKVLIEDTRHHVQEEEGEMFNLVEDQLSEAELEKLGAEMESEKSRYQKANKIPARTAKDEALGKGMLATIVDKVTGLFSTGEEAGAKKNSKGGAKAGSVKKAGASSGKSSTAKSSAGTASSGSSKASGTAASAKYGSGKSAGSTASKPSTGSSSKSSSTASKSKATAGSGSKSTGSSSGKTASKRTKGSAASSSAKSTGTKSRGSGSKSK